MAGQRVAGSWVPLSWVVMGQQDKCSPRVECADHVDDPVFLKDDLDLGLERRGELGEESGHIGEGSRQALRTLCAEGSSWVGTGKGNRREG